MMKDLREVFRLVKSENLLEGTEASPKKRRILNSGNGSFINAKTVLLGKVGFFKTVADRLAA